MCGQALVPLTGPGLRDGFHEVPLQLTDTGMMPEQVLLRLSELLNRGNLKGERQCGGGGVQEEGNRKFGRDKWSKGTTRGEKVQSEDR